MKRNEQWCLPCFDITLPIYEEVALNISFSQLAMVIYHPVFATRFRTTVPLPIPQAATTQVLLSTFK